MNAIGATGESGCGSDIRGGATTGNWAVTATGGRVMKWIAARALGDRIRTGWRCGRAPWFKPMPPMPTRAVRPRSFRPRRRPAWMDMRAAVTSTHRGKTATRGGQFRTVSRRRRMRRDQNRQDLDRPGWNRVGRRRPMRSMRIRSRLGRRRPNRAAGVAAPGPSATDRSLSGLG